MNEKSAYYIDKIRELEDEIFELKADRNAATIMEQRAENSKLSLENKMLISDNKDLQEGIHIRDIEISKLYFALSEWERRYLDISNEKDTALADKITLADSMRSCLEEREAFIKSLINEIVEKNLEIERLNRFIKRIHQIEGREK